MKKGDKLFSVYIDIEEDDNNNVVKTSCGVDEFYISSIQNRRFWKHSKSTTKYIYINRKDGSSYDKVKFDEFNVKDHTLFGNSEISAIKKAIKRLPKLIKKNEEYFKEDDYDYFKQYESAYASVRRTLGRMIGSAEKRLEKKKMLAQQKKDLNKRVREALREPKKNSVK